MTRDTLKTNGLESDLASSAREVVFNVMIIGGLVFIFSILGILTRPAGFLAAFWPANAVLLGFLVRHPERAGLSGWSAAAAAYLAADILTGGSWPVSTMLMMANLLGIMTGYVLFSRVSQEHRLLKQPSSMVYFVLITITASTVSGLVGMVANPLFFDGSSVGGMLLWFTSEFVNYLVILPVMLTMPAFYPRRQDMRRYSFFAKFNLRNAAPVLSLGLGLLLGIVIGGPGVLAYCVPGLLWCALTYGLFITALLTLFSSMWMLLATSLGYLQLDASFDGPYALESFRLGVTLIALAPLTVASVMEARNELLRQLQHTAMHDQLTKVLNRSGFIERAALLFKQIGKTGNPVTALMIDIDYFKKVNDTYGHAVGDMVLAGFAGVAMRCLRETDILGRFGGEEFAVLLPDCNQEVARVVAQRICDAFANHTFTLEDGAQLKVTVSVGMAYSPEVPLSLETILLAADNELLSAKKSGRNQVMFTVLGISGATI